MPKIQQLDAHVADLIAAGEVVERPASVVKELVENAIDAGATAVTVEIQHGGMSLIRVTDNGGGIPEGECETAFLRHATSKLRSAADLEAIGTLGFRGEALAAISAVSRVELFTRPAEAPLGTALTLEGGRVCSHEETGCPLGTTLVVRDLFFNTPARQKFMKKDTAEGAAVFALVQRLALSHPEVSVKFLRDGKQELITPGDGTLRSALYTVFGRDIALGFTPVQTTVEDVTVEGFASMPACCRGTRGYQHFFVNGRYVKAPLLTAALERAYENQKMVGKFPGCVLHLTVKKSGVDVNVHPAKTEVKFLFERQVFDGVYYGVLSALTGEGRHPGLWSGPSKAPTAPPVGKGFGRMTAAEFQKAPPLRDGVMEARAPVKGGQTLGAAWAISPKIPEKLPQEREFPLKNVEKTVEKVENSPARSHKFPTEGSEPLAPPHPAPPSAEEPEEPSLFPSPGEGEWRIAGEVLQTYLIVERGEEILFIDKHAAHERMQFDRMREESYAPMAQTLLVPVVFTPEPEEGAALLAQLPLLEQFGFRCEDFGGGALVVREIPSDLEPGQAESALCEIAEQLLCTGQADPTAARDAVLHTMACKAAIKGGQNNSSVELLEVAKAVVSGRVKYCPHGRPVAVTMTRAQLEKQFGRA